MTHICVSKLTIIGSNNGLSPGRRQAIIWTITGILLIGPFGTNFSEILIKIHTFSFKQMRLKMSSEKRRPSCLGLNVVNWRGFNFLCITHCRPPDGIVDSMKEVLTYRNIPGSNILRHGDVFRITGPLWGPQCSGFPSQRASNVVL